jgi:UDP-3-O-[3-hydroxymyristoyl] N-acetylglucosamine deacetylase/3-hydroxyacyl-[acyl-carrier-protein] dehydratase
MQRTIGRETAIEGIGLHTGEKGIMKFLPAPVGHGVRFVRVDLDGSPEVRVRPENAHFDPGAGRRTILQQDGVQIHTMEHVLSAVAGLGIDNLRIEVSSMEVPEGHDGSAAPIARALMGAGIVEQDKPTRHIKVTKPVSWSEHRVELQAVPYGGFRITFTIEYDHPLIGVQTISLDITPEVFLEQIAPARTFVLERDLDVLRQSGWIKGGRIESAIVVGADRVLNDEPLRFPDEFVRHKVLDLLGDLFILGGPLLGHVTAKRSGHQGHVAFVKMLKETLPLPGRRAGGPPEEWDTTAIMDLMPHRYPFLLVDRITSIEEGQSCEGFKNVTINEPFFQGHFPGQPTMPGVLILEAMAQVGGMLMLNSVDDPANKLMYFMGIDGAKFRRPVVPGDRLTLQVTVLRHKGQLFKAQGQALVDGQVCAEAEFLATIMERQGLEAQS